MTTKRQQPGSRTNGNQGRFQRCSGDDTFRLCTGRRYKHTSLSGGHSPSKTTTRREKGKSTTSEGNRCITRCIARTILHALARQRRAMRNQSVAESGFSAGTMQIIIKCLFAFLNLVRSSFKIQVTYATFAYFYQQFSDVRNKHTPPWGTGAAAAAS